MRYILNSRTPVENFWEKMQKSHAILENINLIFRDMTCESRSGRSCGHSVFAPLPHLHRKILKSPLPLPPRRRHWKRFVPCLASKRSMCLPWETAITICPCWNLRALALHGKQRGTHQGCGGYDCGGLQSLWRGKNSGTITKGKSIRRTIHEYFKCSKAQPRLW